MEQLRTIKRVLVANRGEIAIRVLRACNELGIHTIAVYAKEDALSLHRNRADEAYLIGKDKSAIDAYLDMDDILRVAREQNADAIHPGYGFLAENAEFARRCEEAGIIFIGPRPEHLEMFGDKINARRQAEKAGIRMIPGSDGPVQSVEDVRAFAAQYGLPLIIKAVHGGGGRGMRVVEREEEIAEAFERACSEALYSFGNGDVYIEKYIPSPKHIEVQIMGDCRGEVVHLFERDCSIQRRHQKVVEIAPAFALPLSLRQEICAAAVRLMRNVGYLNAGTVEFLVDEGGEFYFIEVNPRIQVEHTVTEMVTDIDIVQAQILLAAGYILTSPEVGIGVQEEIHLHGNAIQCRITTENPENHFMPDTGKIIAYRSGGGFGIRLDAGTAYTGAVITPYYDSLLVKATTHGTSHRQAARKMERALKEFRVRGVKTNIYFLINVMQHPDFLSGHYDVNFIDTHPELFRWEPPKDRGTKLLRYIATTTVNGYAGVGPQPKPEFDACEPLTYTGDAPRGTKQLLDELGPERFAQWVKEQKEVFFTDTTYRDAHQSLMATRLRTYDILGAIGATARRLPQLFSFENWGGATFDVAYRFLDESPWDRLRRMRKAAPNILFQMLTRGANTVGYTNYHETVIRDFIARSAECGIDVFRIFDCLNNLDQMRVTIDEVRRQNKIAEVALCYTGDILDPKRQKYDLAYYVRMAKECAAAGAHIIAIKDMAGLLKPEAAYALTAAIKDAVDLPLHLHSHEGAGNTIYTYARAVEAGVDIIDVAAAAFAGGTSQPAMSSMWYALSNHPRQPKLDIEAMEDINHYWEKVRPYYRGIDHASNYPNTTVYRHEMPGGQFSNLQQQAKGVGLGDRWEEVCQRYAEVNLMFGDIIKVTPSSKVVGDMALFMVQNDLHEQDIYERGRTMSFPQSVVEFFAGKLGIPYGGFPEKLRDIILKGRVPEGVPVPAPVDLAQVAETMREKQLPVRPEDVTSYNIYPDVFATYAQRFEEYGDLSVLDTPTFFFGMNRSEEIRVTIEQGKTLVIRLTSIHQPDENGDRVVQFEINGMPREVVVHDRNLTIVGGGGPKADKQNPGEVGATLSGSIVKVLVNLGDAVEKGDPLVITEAMKMETTITAPVSGNVSDILVSAGARIESGDLLIVLE